MEALILGIYAGIVWLIFFKIQITPLECSSKSNRFYDSCCGNDYADLATEYLFTLL
jgi:hypothetical protein